MDLYNLAIFSAPIGSNSRKKPIRFSSIKNQLNIAYIYRRPKITPKTHAIYSYLAYKYPLQLLFITDGSYNFKFNYYFFSRLNADLIIEKASLGQPQCPSHRVIVYLCCINVKNVANISIFNYMNIV